MAATFSPRLEIVWPSHELCATWQR